MIMATFKGKKVKNMEKYNTILSALTTFFDVNDDLRNELNNLSIKEHGKSLNELIELCAKDSVNLPDSDYNEYLNYLNELNKEPHSISEMDEMYSFIYDF